jgi:hypothetical protein
MLGKEKNAGDKRRMLGKIGECWGKEKKAGEKKRMSRGKWKNAGEK